MLSKIINFITHDPVRKIFALIFAFCLWIYVAIGNNYTYQRMIKVVYTNTPDSLIVVDSTPSIDVVFSGRGGALFGIWAAPPQAQCDLEKVGIGKKTIPPSQLKIPIGYGPLRIDYNTPVITVTIDRRIAKDIKINVPIKDTPRQGSAVDTVAVLDKIRVTGPQKMLVNIREISTESLSVKNRSASFEKELRLDLPSSLLSVQRRTAMVRVKIDQTVQKTLTYVPLTLIYGSNQNVKVDKNYLDTLVVMGTPKRLLTLTSSDVEIRIDLTELDRGEYNVPAAVILPEHITPVRSTPQRFNIRIY